MLILNLMTMKMLIRLESVEGENYGKNIPAFDIHLMCPTPALHIQHCIAISTVFPGLLQRLRRIVVINETLRKIYSSFELH